MRKVILLLFSLPGSGVVSASVLNIKGGFAPLPKPTRVGSAAIVQRFISLENNKSKPHRFMALPGVLPGLFCIASVYALATLF